MRAAVLALTLLPACAASLSSFQPAHVPPRGHVQVETGVDASIPTGTISKTVDAAKTLVKAASTVLEIVPVGMDASTPPRRW